VLDLVRRREEYRPSMSGDSPGQKWAVCTCNTCSGHLEFDASNAGTTVQCPHCGRDTLLIVPEVPLPSPPEPEEPPAKPEPKKAEIVEQASYEDAGVEGRLELGQTAECGSDSRVGERLEIAADLFLWVGLIGGGVALVAALGTSMDEGGHPGTWVIVGVAAIVQGVVAWLLFRAGAEVIRLLKQINRSRFTGKITQRSVQRSHKCSLCGATVAPAQAKCFRCGAEFSRESRIATATPTAKLSA
jgi:DNA-directed RNA polymerase subunit RPC12/RpoP